jgi:single-strand DNA-binding protein
MNLVQIVGNLGKAPEFKELGENKTQMCTFTVATTEYGRDAQKYTEWHSCKVFGKIAVACSKYITKGSKVAVIGRLQTRSWDDGSGVKKYRTEIICEKVEFLTKKEKESEAGSAEGFDAGVPPNEDVTEMSPEDMF